MTFLNIQTITRAIIFILRFKSENDEQRDDFLLIDDLKTVQLQSLHDIFQGDRDHPFSRFKAQNYDLERDDLVLKEILNRHQNRASIQHNCNCLICSGINENRGFREIHIPVSKALFLKAINFSPGQDTILSTKEVYDVIYHLFMILDNTNVMAYTLLKQLLADNGLYDTLKILHQEYIHSVMSRYKGTLEAKKIEIENQEHILYTAFVNIHRIAMQEFIFVYKDEHNNIALTTSKGDNKRKPHVVVDINLKDLWKPFCYLKMDTNFLGQNSSLLQELLYKNSIFRANVMVEIDFTKFYQFFKFTSEYRTRETLTQTEALEPFLSGIFGQVNAFRLRLSEMVCSIDFRYLLDKKTTLLCNNLLFTSAVYLPQKLECISIHDSGIEGNLVLPTSTKALSLRKVIIDIEARIIVNDECLRIEIEEAIGNIDIPASFGIDAFSFNKQWKKCHILRNSTGVLEELSIVKAKLSQDSNINVGVKKIYLEDIKTEGTFSIKINVDCENLSFKNCTAACNLVKNTLLTSFGQIEFSMENEFHLSNENGEYKLNIRNIYLTTIVSLNGRITTIMFESVYVQGVNIFFIHIGCSAIVLKNCLGSFDCFFETSMRRIDLFQSRNYFSLQYNKNTGKYKMSLIEGKIDVSWMPWDKLEELHLESITNEDSQCFEIKEGCNNIKLLKCRGYFKIPGIQSGIQNANLEALVLSISTNELYLTKLSDKEFLLHMSNIFIYQTIHILLDIRSAKLEGIVGHNGAGIEFRARCKVLFLINCNILLDQFGTSIYQRLILNKMFEIDHILKTQTKELFISNCTITKKIKLGNTLYKLHLYGVKVLKNNTITIPKQCVNIIVKSFFGAFIILGLNDHESRAIMFFEKVGCFHFSKYKGDDYYLLKIDNCDIDGSICIRKEIKYAILSNITFISNRTERNVDERTVLMTESLQSLTLKSSPFLYNAMTHRKLTYLHLEGMCFNDNVIIGGSIKSLILKDVTIEGSSSVILGENTLYLEIYDINGMLNFNGLLDFKRLRFFGDEKIVYEKELQSGTVHLEIENLTLFSDFQIAEEIRILYLTRIKIKNDSKILVNRSCKKIISDFEGRIYFIEEKSIEKAVFINLLPLFEIGCWTFATSHNIEEIRTPSYLRSIKFEDIELTATTVIINEDCENVTIIHCDGNFNLVNIQKLSKLTLHSGGLKGMSLTLPDFSHIGELDLAFDFTFDFFENLLCSCFNVKILTLRALTFIPSDTSWRQFLASDAKPCLSPFDSFHLKELKKSLNENFPSEENKSNLWMLLNKKMNILTIPVFNTRSQFKLEVLKIVGFYLSDENLERLSNFSIMRRLSVDYNFVSVGLFERLPPNLETLEILSSSIFEPDNKNCMKNVRNAEAIKNIIAPKMLIIEGSFFETIKNFSNIPQNLHSLKISYHDLSCLVYEPSIEKIRLRVLIVFFKPSKNEKRYFALSSSIEKKICMQEMFRCLSDFIDFNRLDSLMVEDGDDTIEYDRFEIY